MLAMIINIMFIIPRAMRRKIPIISNIRIADKNM
jgi:hypothetical protein